MDDDNDDEIDRNPDLHFKDKRSFDIPVCSPTRWKAGSFRWNSNPGHRSYESNALPLRTRANKT